MNLELSTQTVDMTVGSTVVLHDARDTQIVCVEGEIWITEHRLRNDVVLSPGESRILRVDGRTYVTAFAPSRVRLLEPRSGRSWWRRAALRARLFSRTAGLAGA